MDNSKKAIIFDLGRVLIQYNYKNLLSELAKKSSLKENEFMDLIVDPLKSFGTGTLNTTDFHRILTEQFDVVIDLRQMDKIFCNGMSRDERGLAYVVNLHQKLNKTIGVISNTNPIHASWLRSNIPELTLFESIIFSYEVGLRKPDPGIFSLALSYLEISASQACFVDDMLENVEAACEVGMKGFLHVDWITTRQNIETWLGL